MARNYRAEYQARKARASANNIPLRIATGHARPGEPGMAAIRSRAARQGQSLQVAARDALAAVQRPQGPQWRSPRTDLVDVGGGRLILDTRNKADALKFLKQAARDGKEITIIGTRGKADGSKGVPLYGGGQGGRVSAQDFLDLVMDDYGGDIWDAIDGEADDNYGGVSAVSAVHFYAV
jgi:hypothetical protein